jgi:uncharacterized protein YdbL (DUF1318 family)
MRSVIPRQIVAILLLAFAFQTAWAIDIHSAKDQGLVGEANTGYLAAVGGSPSAEVKALITEVNRKRKAEFERTANKTGATLEQVRFRFYELPATTTRTSRGTGSASSGRPQTVFSRNACSASPHPRARGPS